MLVLNIRGGSRKWILVVLLIYDCAYLPCLLVLIQYSVRSIQFEQCVLIFGGTKIQKVHFVYFNFFLNLYQASWILSLWSSHRIRLQPVFWRVVKETAKIACCFHRVWPSTPDGFAQKLKLPTYIRKFMGRFSYWFKNRTKFTSLHAKTNIDMWLLWLQMLPVLLRCCG